MIVLAAPALPLHAVGKYVAGAYVVFVVMLLVYLGIMTLRASRTRRELAELRRELAERRAREELEDPPPPGPGVARAEQPEREVAL
jgi:flagellar biosynthesis/type III secretory pathway M-ring protein FliF/YscJ